MVQAIDDRIANDDSSPGTEDDDATGTAVLSALSSFADSIDSTTSSDKTDEDTDFAVT